MASIEPAEPRGKEANLRFLGACSQLIVSIGLVLVAATLISFAMFVPGVMVLVVAVPLGVRAWRSFGRQVLTGDIR